MSYNGIDKLVKPFTPNNEDAVYKKKTPKVQKIVTSDGFVEHDVVR